MLRLSAEISLPYVDGSRCDGRRCPAARIAFDGHGDVRRKTDGGVLFT